jgi:hypothetical protein
MSEKIVGYLLLTVGLLTIGLSAFNIYQVFTKKIQPLQLFTGPGISFDLSGYLPEVPGSKPAPKTDLVSASTINEISNLSAHYLLISFLAGIGFKVSSLGIQLLRPVEIKIQPKSSTPTP